ncbi:hypothetical protein BDF20DRAFT_837778 [Mycotypha africana]|uniref:uncharacterized protein n=1 Tax=Mycotypha africana TaxID=64632 RepID=UPI0023004F09|nr:uncharacterized protein BDF20DRAFT_837778 [Mycotypha africana]KAI8971446.1 hypothetical protein BDF20DRAFT_837778 [Mycotypha africana]
MGSALSSIGKHRRLVDYGYTVPLGLYADNNNIHKKKGVRNDKKRYSDLKHIEEMIVTRKLSPFYKGLPTEPFYEAADSSLIDCLPGEERMFNCFSKPLLHRRITSTELNFDIEKTVKHGRFSLCFRPMNERHQRRRLYYKSVECPICLLYYPCNINYSICCNQPICSECFVEIIRNRIYYVKMKSREAVSLEQYPQDNLCPFCMTEDFRVKYNGSPSFTDDFTEKATAHSHTFAAFRKSVRTAKQS